jgi:hypothetical protein
MLQSVKDLTACSILSSWPEKRHEHSCRRRINDSGQRLYLRINGLTKLTQALREYGFFLDKTGAIIRRQPVATRNYETRFTLF